MIPARVGAPPFSEAGARRDAGNGWQPLFGSFHGAGYSIEWHDFLRSASSTGPRVFIPAASRFA